MDVSSSVDAREDALQRGGLVSALRAPDVQNAFMASPDPVALSVFEWSGRFNQSLLTDWTLVTSSQVLEEIATKVEGSSRSQSDFPTAMGYAFGYSAALFDRAPDCLTQTLDVAGDGQSNDGFGPAEAYTAFPLSNVVVNGLVIDDNGLGAQSDLYRYYESDVIQGPGRFIEIANGFEDYANALERKLIREVSAMIVGSAPAEFDTPG